MLFFSCTDPKKQEEQLLEEVINIHDKVMAKDAQLMKNKIQLDTLLKSKLASGSADSVILIQLNNADAEMEDWMHKFDAENKGKSHEEIVDYLSGQKKAIDAIDKKFDSVLNASTTYLKSLKK